MICRVRSAMTRPDNKAGVRTRAAPSVLSGRSDRSREILHARSNPVVRRIVRTKRLDCARGIEPVNPAPEAIGRINFDRAGRRCPIFPEIRLAIEIPCHLLKCVSVLELRAGMYELSDLEPQWVVRSIRVLRRTNKNQHEQLAFVDYVELWIPVHERAKIFDFFWKAVLPSMSLYRTS